MSQNSSTSTSALSKSQEAESKHVSNDSKSSGSTLMSNNSGSGSDNEEEDEYYRETDRIDYTKAMMKESRTYNEIYSKLQGQTNVTDFQKVQNGFTQLTYDDRLMDKKAKNHFVFDTLPSFEMYQSMQSGDPEELLDNPDEHSYPPGYLRVDDVTSQSCDASVEFSTRTGTTSSLFSPAPTETDETLPSIARPSFPEPMLDEEYQRHLLDKAPSLENIKSQDLDIQVVITKDAPQPDCKDATCESMLKEYTSGDVVHGYVICHNKSDKPVKFQMFYVTLEGYTSRINPVKGKQSIQRFLTMVDLSASWTFGCVSPAANFKFEALSKDQNGNTLGLPNDRILLPHTKYKKFFTFKFPYNGLDNNCRHQHEIHTLLPPSFGVDMLRDNGKYRNIEYNTALHYGHTGTRGSPILTKDLSQSTLSINYTINTRVIGVHPSNQRKLCIYKAGEYNLRFIPYGFAVPLFSSRSTLDSFTSNIEHVLEVAEQVLKLKTKGGSQEQFDEFVKELKNRQLECRSSSNSSVVDRNFPMRNKNFGNADYSRVDAHLAYEGSKLSKSGFLQVLKMGNAKPVKPQGNDSGMLSMSTRIPKDGLPYLSPKLIRNANNVNDLTEVGFKNFDNLASSLSANEKKKLTSLKINFAFTPSDFSNNTSPPDIKSIKVSLLALNISSSTSIPLKLSPDLFTSDKSKKLIEKFEKYHETYLKLSDEFQDASLDLHRYVDYSVFKDITAMRDIKVDKFIIDAFNYSTQNQSQWKKDDKNESWKTTIDLNLSLKDDIQETLVPNFQTCLLSRIYNIKVSLKMKNGQTSELLVPIRLRCFDDI